jgi:hypothetical protein
MLKILPALLALALAATSAAATPSIQYITDGTVPSFATVLNYSNLGEWRGDPVFGNTVVDSVNSLNGTTSLLFSGNSAGVSGVPYSSAVLYTEAISDGSASNGRGGLINGGLNGGWGALKVRGKVVSTRTTAPIRSYAEATADAYLTFRIDDPSKIAGVDTVRVHFYIDTDLTYWRNRAPSTSADRYVNWATYGGLLQTPRPAADERFNLSTDPSNNSSPLFVTDENNNYINLTFDDPARSDQYDAGDPNVIVDLSKTADPLSGRGGPIPEVSEYLGTNRTSLGVAGDLITLAQLQELMLQDTNPANPANNADATNPLYSVGNVTFNAGQGYYDWYFDAVVGTEYVIYTQLSANITDDGGVDGKFGASSNAEDFGSLYYGLEIVVPEPATIIMIGLGLAGAAAAVRRRLN